MFWAADARNTSFFTRIREFYKQNFQKTSQEKTLIELTWSLFPSMTEGKRGMYCSSNKLPGSPCTNAPAASCQWNKNRANETNSAQFSPGQKQSRRSRKCSKSQMQLVCETIDQRRSHQTPEPYLSLLMSRASARDLLILCHESGATVFKMWSWIASKMARQRTWRGRLILSSSTERAGYFLWRIGSRSE